MKKFLFIPVALLFLSACNQAELDKSNHKNDSLSSVVTMRDSSLAEFIETFNEIESNLDSVAAKQQIISDNSNKFRGELKGNKKARINAEIAAINGLMEKNKYELDKLQKRLANSKHSNALLEKTIKTLTVQLSQKDFELCELNLRLDGLNSKVAKLNSTVDSVVRQNFMQSMVIDYQTSDLHTAYYKVGESKELRDEKIIDKKGGVLGIGKTTKLNADFDKTMFTQIDFTKTTTIPVDGDDIKIVTSHPSDSYKLDNDDKEKSRTKNIIITNPDKFWSASKYLVVVVKK